MHHYCGKEDKLGLRLQVEASNESMKVDVISIDKENGYDLRADVPFKAHLEQAGEGRIDGYHSGFPCTTFSRLRWRQSPGLPGPVRSVDFPYGCRDLDERRKKEADDGTIMMAHSSLMVGEQYKADRFMAVGGFSTLENPPIRGGGPFVGMAHARNGGLAGRDPGVQVRALQHLRLRARAADGREALQARDHWRDPGWSGDVGKEVCLRRQAP